MGKEGIEKVMNVWESQNKIQKPVKQELYLDIIERVASLFAAGSFYYYIFNFETMKMDFVHGGVEKVLGIKPHQLTLDSLLGRLHPEDIEKMHEKESLAANFLLKKISREDLPHYKVVYFMRIMHTDGTYKTILHQSKTLVVSEEGKVQQVLGIHTDVSYLNVAFDHKVSFIGDNKPSYYALETGEEYKRIDKNCSKLLTSREKEIIKKLAEGKNFNEIAVSLFLSPHTINTHKRNILKKVGCKNTTELVAMCIREGII